MYNNHNNKGKDNANTIFARTNRGSLALTMVTEEPLKPLKHRTIKWTRLCFLKQVESKQVLELSHIQGKENSIGVVGNLVVLVFTNLSGIISRGSMCSYIKDRLRSASILALSLPSVLQAVSIKSQSNIRMLNWGVKVYVGIHVVHK